MVQCTDFPCVQALNCRSAVTMDNNLDKLPNSNCYQYSASGGCGNQSCMNIICLFDDHCCLEN